jgi:aryl-phospho-beta-D-glucosidase BglC (GH1 family)
MARYYFALLLLLAGSAPLSAQSPTSVTQSRYNNLLSGINLSNRFQCGSQSAPVPTSEDLSLLLGAGFTSVRLPVAPEYLLSDIPGSSCTSAANIDEHLGNLDAAINLFLKGSIAVMLDFHPDPTYVSYYQSNHAAAQNELVTLWTSLAGRYANRDPEHLFFEIMNEPSGGFTDGDQIEILNAIHGVAPRFTVLVEPVNGSDAETLIRMTPYPDTNVIYAIHDYSPLQFTEQGAYWTGAPYPSLANVPYPSYLPGLQTLISTTTDPANLCALQQYQAGYWDALQVAWDIQLAAGWAKYWSQDVVVNEFGVYQASPADSRACWIYDMQTAMKNMKIGWAMWDYDGGFGLVMTGASNSRTIDPAIGGALGLPGMPAPACQVPAGVFPPAFDVLRPMQVGSIPDGKWWGNGILAADLNGDGYFDLVLAPHAGSGSSTPDLPLQIFLNQGNGVMAPAAFSGPAPTVENVATIVSGKFDNSGWKGLFLPDSSAHSRLVLPVAGSNAFKDATGNLPSAIISTIGAAVGDVNGDGIDDLVVFQSGQPMQLLRNDGAGDFAIVPGAFPGSAGSLPFVCGVFVQRRGKNVPDLAVFGGQNSSGGQIFVNDGSGNFSAGPPLPPPIANGGTAAPIAGSCAATADLNDDGWPDLVVGYQDAVQILIGQSNGTFTDQTSTWIELPATLGTLNRLSLASLNEVTLLLLTTAEPMILVSNSGNMFKTTSSWGTQPIWPWLFTAADFDRDGKLDLAFSEDMAGLQVRFGRSDPVADGAALGPLLAIAKRHRGDFVQGQSGATYCVEVSNSSVYSPASGPVTVAENAPAGLMLKSMSGTGWMCGPNEYVCTRSDALAPNASYPQIIVSVDVAGAAPQVTNQACICGGASVSDLTNVTPSVPSAVSISPSAGTGTTQTFALAMSDTAGPAAVSTAYFLVNSVLSGSNGCYIEYNRGANTLRLATDAGTGWLGPVTLGTGSSINNRQCTLNPASSSAAISGNSITVNVALSFSGGFAGAKSMWLVVNDASGPTSGFQSLGWWTVLGSGGVPSAVSVSPNSGTGSAQTFMLGLADTSGAGSITTAYFLVNATLNGSKGCFIEYNRSGNTLRLANDAASGWLGPVTPGASSTVNNSQCTLNSSGVSAAISGNNITVSVALSFSGAFGGTKNLWLGVTDASGAESGFQNLGSWTVPASSGVPSAVSVTPGTGSGLAQTFALSMSDTGGAGAIATAYLVVNATLSGSSGCFIEYNRVTNTLRLANDAASAWLGPVTPGMGSSIGNSQCTLNPAGSSVTTSGNTITVNVALSFNAGFAGAKSLWLGVTDVSGAESGFQNLG